jgi:hypothetical protein
MQNFAHTQVVAWCREHGITISADGGLERTPQARFQIRLELPSQPYKLPWFAKDLVGLTFLNSTAETLLWIYGLGIWTEEMEAVGIEYFDRLASTQEQGSRLTEFPGRLIHASENNLALMLTLFPLIFGWDSYLIGATSDPIVFISHDEFVQVDISDPAVTFGDSPTVRTGPERF